MKSIKSKLLEDILPDQADVTYKFHHIGIPTTEKREGERYSSTFKMYTSTAPDPKFRVQYHRFEEGSPLHPLIQTMPHVAFKVNDIQKAIKGYQVLMEPYAPFRGYQAAIVLVNGTLIEFLQTTLTEEEIWSDAPRTGSYIYPEDNEQ